MAAGVLRFRAVIEALGIAPPRPRSNSCFSQDLVSCLPRDTGGPRHRTDCQARSMATDDQRPHNLALTLKLELCFLANSPVFSDCADDFLGVVEALGIVRQVDTTLCAKPRVCQGH